MNEYIQKLVAVEQKIEDLIIRKSKLKELEGENRLSNKEEAELDGIQELLVVLEKQQKFWQSQVNKANSLDEQVESKTFSEANLSWIASVCEVDCRYRRWTQFVLDENVTPSDRFKANFIETQQVFHQLNEAGRRVFLNLFLSDIVGSDPFLNTLRIFTEIPMEVLSTSVAENGKRRRLNGKTDYTIGFGGEDFDMFDITPPNELHLVAVEAKCNLSESDFWQCFAETATLYKSRKDKKKKKLAVWGVCSDAVDWIFIHIDQKGLLYRSEKYTLDLRTYEEQKIFPIYRMLYYLVDCCFQSSPHNSSTDLAIIPE
jgi:hypothetical protein